MNPLIPTPQITLGSCRVSRVLDGDTIEVEVVRRVRVRVVRCFSAETRTKNHVEKREGLRAKKVAKQLLPVGSPVVLQMQSDGDLDFFDDTTFGRCLGDVWRTDGHGLSFGELMKTAGHAFETQKDLQAHLDEIEHREAMANYDEV